ncbi:MAG: thiamine pyrophosphate-binding protein [Acidobacteriota bacterium]
MPHRRPHADSPVPAQATRLLFVDDDQMLLHAVQRGLRNHKDLEISVATNAIDAMLALGQSRPDLVLMDVYMPGLDGIEACRRIKSNPDTASLRIILTSATMTPDLQEAALAAGAEQAIEKPTDLKTLIALTRPARVAARAAEPPRAPLTVRGADLLVEMLADAGVEVVFGLPGGAISPVHDALLDSSIRCVTTRHESGAMFAAAGYAHATGKLGVVAVTSGPGALNAMTGLASAWCDGLPLLLLVGEVPRPAHGKGVLQDGSSHGLQIVEMARHVTKLAAEVPRPSTLPHLLRRAIATALSGRRGPVLLTLPLDVTTAQVCPPRVGGAVTVGQTLAPLVVDEIAELVTGASRPLIIAGSGVRGNGAPERLRVVAERLGCPVVTTPKGKGVFPENHPLSLGVLGLGGHPSARAYLDTGLDVVVAIGTSLGDLATDGFSPELQATRALVHVDIDARQIGKSYSPTHAVVASAAELLGSLAERLDGRATAVSRELSLRGVERLVLPHATQSGYIAPQDALEELQRALPADTIFTIDSGEHTTFSLHYLRIDHPDAFVVMTGLGSMGQSIGAAIGAQLAHPERSIAAIVGDGCFAMNAFEIATAVAERLPIRIFVFNDERLGMVENGHKAVYGRTPEFGTGHIDICSIARGLGAATLRVDTVGQLAAAEDVLRLCPGPVVIDVRVDPAITIKKRDRIGNIVKPPQWSVSKLEKTKVPHLRVVRQ